MSNTAPIITQEEFEPTFVSQPKVTMVLNTLLISHSIFLLDSSFHPKESHQPKACQKATSNDT
jgi:hypothetical protein